MLRSNAKARAAASAVLLVALAMPVWGAAGGLRPSGWNTWHWLLSLVQHWVAGEKDGPCIDPEGKPCVPRSVPALLDRLAGSAPRGL